MADYSIPSRDALRENILINGLYPVHQPCEVIAQTNRSMKGVCVPVLRRTVDYDMVFELWLKILPRKQRLSRNHLPKDEIGS